MLKLMIFDFDGTLVDTMTDVALTFNQILLDCGYPTHQVVEYERFVGGNLEQVISRLLPETRRGAEDIDRVKALYRERYAASPKPNTRPYPGIPELLRDLLSLGVQLAINTNKAQELIDPMAGQHFPGLPFVGVLGYREGFPPKPSPAATQELMERTGAAPWETAYVGDGESDILTAQAAGIPLLFVPWGQGSGISRNDPRLSLVAHTAQDLYAYAAERMQV